MKYNIWNKWDPLQVCMLGNTYFPEYFDTLDQKVANLQKRISEETLEDIDNFKKILKDFGIDVIQPSVNSNVTSQMIPQGGGGMMSLDEPLAANSVLGGSVF